MPTRDSNALPEFGRQFREQRLARGLSQTQIAVAFKVNERLISTVEQGGGKTFALHHLETLRRAFGWSAHELRVLRKARLMARVDRQFAGEVNPSVLMRMKLAIWEGHLPSPGPARRPRRG